MSHVQTVVKNSDMGPIRLQCECNFYKLINSKTAAGLCAFLPVEQLSSGHQLQHQRDVGVRLKDLLQLDLSHTHQRTGLC